MTQFMWRVRRTGVTVVLELIGEVDIATAPLLRHALADLIEGQGNRHLAVDMSELAFIDSSGLYVLVDAYRRVTGAGGSFVLWDPRPSILRVLEVTGIGPMLAVEATDAREGATG